MQFTNCNSKNNSNNSKNISNKNNFECAPRYNFTTSYRYPSPIHEEGTTEVGVEIWGWEIY